MEHAQLVEGVVIRDRLKIKADLHAAVEGRGGGDVSYVQRAVEAERHRTRLIQGKRLVGCIATAQNISKCNGGIAYLVALVRTC